MKLRHFNITRHSLQLAIALTALLASHTAQAATFTWTPTVAGTYNWDDASSNWSAGFPNAIGDVANLNINLAGVQTINLNQAITIGTLNIGDNTSGFFGTTLADGTSGSLIFDAFGTGSAQLNKPTTANNVNDIISATTLLNDDLEIANSSTTSGGTLTLSGGITSGTAGTKTITNRGTGTQAVILGGVIGKGSGDVALLQDSPTSTLTLNGAAANTFTGGVNIKRGTLQLDFSNFSAAANLVDGGNALTLGSGTLSIKGYGSGSTTQSFGSIAFNGGGAVLINPNGGTDTTFALGSITDVNTVGRSLLLGKTASPGTGNAIITTSIDKDPQGLYYGGRVVYTSDGGTTVDWATTASSGGPTYTLGAYGTDFGVYVALDTTAGTDTNNSRITAGATLGGSRETNTLKIDGGGQTLALVGNTLTLTSGSLLSTGTTLSTISGTTGATRLKGSASGDLIIQQYNTGGLTISAVIGNNGGATALTKAGPGTLTLSGINTYTGGTFINGGTLAITNVNQVNSASVTLNGGTFSLTQTGSTVPQLTVGPNGGTMAATSGNRTESNDISGSGNLYWGSGSSQDDRFSRVAGYSLTGDFVLTSNVGNIFMGSFPNATVDIQTANGINKSNNYLPNPIFGGLKGFGNLQLVNFGSLLSIGNNNKDTLYTGSMSGATPWSKIGTGTLTMTGINSNTGPTYVTNGTLVLAGANTGTGFTKINGGTLQIANNLALQNSALVTSGAGALTFAPGINTPTFGGLSAGTNLTLAANVTSLTLNPGAGVTAAYSGTLDSATPGMTLTKTGAGTQILSGTNAFTGTTTLTAGALSVGADANLGGANGLIFNGGTLQVTGTTLTNFGTHTPTFNATKTVGLDISNAASTFTVSQVLNQTTGGLTKSGAGTLVLNGSAVNTYTGATTVNGGILKLDFANLTGATNLIDSGSTLTLGGGTLSILAQPSVATSQTFNGLTVNAGAGAINVSNAVTGTPDALLVLGNITRNAGGTVAFALPGGAQTATNGITTTASLNAAGILGAWATVGDDWASKSGSNIVSLSTYTNISALGSTIANDSTTNVRISSAGSGGNIALGSLTTNINTLLQSTSTAAIVDTANKTLQIGGIMLGSGMEALTMGAAANDGNLTSLTSSGDLTLTNNSTKALTINSIIVNNGTTTLTKSGTGTVVLAGRNSYTGATTINTGGGINVQDPLALGATSGVTVNSGGALQLQGTFTIDRPLVLNGTGVSNAGALRNISGVSKYTGIITLGSPVRINSDAGILRTFGTINGAGFGLTIGGAGDTSLWGILNGAGTTLTMEGTGNLRLGAANTYTGITTINSGTVFLNTGETAGVSGPLGTQTADAAGSIVFGGGTLQFSAGNTNDYSGRFSTASQAIKIDTSSQSITFATPLMSGTGGSLSVSGLGTLTLTALSTYTGATTVNNTATLALNLNTAAGNNVVSSSSALTLGGNLNVIGTGGTTARSQTFNGTTFGAGNSTITPTLAATSSTANVLTLDLGALSRNAGGTSNIVFTGNTTTTNTQINTSSGTLSSLITDANGVAFMTFGTNATSIRDWTVKDAGNTQIVQAPASGFYTAATATTIPGNADIGTFSPTITGDLGNNAVASIRFDNAGASTLTLDDNGGGDATFSVGGILVTSNVGNNTTVIAGTGTLQGPSAGAGDLVIHNWDTSSSVRIDLVIGGSGGFTKSGTGTVILNGSNLYSGPTTIGGGTLQIGNGGTTGDLGGTTGTIVNNGTLTFNRSSASTALTIANNITGSGGLIQNGTGTTILTGTSSYRGLTTVNAGTLTFDTGSVRNWTSRGNTIAANGNRGMEGNGLQVNNGTVNVAGLMDVENVYITGGVINVLPGGEVVNRNSIGNGFFGLSVGGNEAVPAAYGMLNMTGGALTSINDLNSGYNPRFGVGIKGTAAGLIRVSDGTLNAITLLTNSAEITQLGGNIRTAGGSAPFLNTQEGNNNTGNATTVLNVAGGLFDNGTLGLNAGGGTAGSSKTIINMNAGTLWTQAVTQGTGGQGIMNFNGGTLKAGATSATFTPTAISNTTSTFSNYVNGAFGTNAGGAVIDTNNYNITIPNVLRAPTGNGVIGIALSGTNGVGYNGAPLMTISDSGISKASITTTASTNVVSLSDTSNIYIGQTVSSSSSGVALGSIVTAINPGVSITLSQNTTASSGNTLTFKGTGATAYATISGGAINGYVVTNPGVGYVGTVSVALTGGYTSGSPATAGTITTAANTSGGLTKNGLGTLTLSVANTFSGDTKVNAGTLALSNALALQNSALDTSGAGVVTLSSVTTPTLGGLKGGTNLAAVITTGYGTVSSLTLNPGASVTHTYSGSITEGATGMTLTKSGAGTQVLGGTNNHTGITTVSAGTLSIANTGTINSTSGVNIGAANFNYNSSTALTKNVAFTGTGGTLSGSGTINPALTVTSDNSLSPGNSAGTLSLGGGLTIADGGVFVWENNTVNTLGTAGTHWDVANVTGGSATISSTATTGAKLKLMFTDALTNFSDSFWNTSRTWKFITGGVSATNLFDTTNIAVFINSVQQGLTNIITDEGAFSTAVNGSDLELLWTTTGGAPEIAISEGSDITSGGSKGFGSVVVGANTSLTFTISNIGAADLNLTGTPKVAVSGDADFTVTAQPSTPVSSPTGTTTFTVQFAPTLTGARTATLTILNNDSDEGTFTINLTGSGTTHYDVWALSKGLTGLPGSATDPAFDADPDHDGVKNGLEWVLGGNPTQNDAPIIQPAISVSGGSLIQTFKREETSISETALVIEYGSDLVTWPKSVTVGATTSGPDLNGVVVTINTAATPDAVSVNIPTAGNAVGGKLFARMKVTRVP